MADGWTHVFSTHRFESCILHEVCIPLIVVDSMRSSPIRMQYRFTSLHALVLPLVLSVLGISSRPLTQILRGWRRMELCICASMRVYWRDASHWPVRRDCAVDPRYGITHSSLCRSFSSGGSCGLRPPPSAHAPCTQSHEAFSRGETHEQRPGGEDTTQIRLPYDRFSLLAREESTFLPVRPRITSAER